MSFDWSDEAIADLRRLRGEGHSFAEIGRRLGCGKSAALSKGRRIDLPEMPPTGLSPEDREKIIAALLGGMRPFSVHRTMGFSNTTVYRIADELWASGVPKPDYDFICSKPPAAIRPARPARTVTRQAVSDEMGVPPSVTPPRPDCATARDGALSAPSVPIFRARMCGYPMWDDRVIFRDGEPWVCGKPKERGEYCADHAGIVYVPKRRMEAAE